MFPWEGDTDSYAGTLATYGHTGRKTGKELRGKARANKRPPRGLRGNRTRATRVEVTKPTIVATVAKVPEVVKLGLTNNIGADYS